LTAHRTLYDVAALSAENHLRSAVETHADITAWTVVVSSLNPGSAVVAEPGQATFVHSEQGPLQRFSGLIQVKSSGTEQPGEKIERDSRQSESQIREKKIDRTSCLRFHPFGKVFNPCTLTETCSKVGRNIFGVKA
jgi:hypothetical protein